MNRKLLLLLLIAGVSVSSVRAYAHHSFAATYFLNKTLTIEGEVVQISLRNPHTFVHVKAPDENGQMQRWAVEWGARTQLGAEGLTKTTLKPGDCVVITGNPGRDPAEHRLRLGAIVRPADGWKWSRPFVG